WPGLKVDDAEQTLCQGKISGQTKDGNETMVWGDAGEIKVGYLKADKKINYFQLSAGYRGSLDFSSRATSLDDPSKPNPFGVHKYSIGVGRPILRDGAPWQLNWQDFDKQSTEIFDALMATYAPELKSTQKSCKKEGSCLARAIENNEGVFGVRPLGIYFHVANVNA